MAVQSVSAGTGIIVSPTTGDVIVSLATPVSIAHGGTNSGGPYAEGGIFLYNAGEFAALNEFKIDIGNMYMGIGLSSGNPDAQIQAYDTAGPSGRHTRINYPDGTYAYGMHTDGDMYLGGLVRSKFHIGLAAPDNLAASLAVTNRTSDNEELLSFFESKLNTQRAEVTVANSGDGGWTHNFLSMLVCGSEYPTTYYTDDDAGAAILVAQGDYCTKLALATYNNQPIQFHIGGTFVVKVNASGLDVVNGSYYAGGMQGYTGDLKDSNSTKIADVVGGIITGVSF